MCLFIYEQRPRARAHALAFLCDRPHSRTSWLQTAAVEGGRGPPPGRRPLPVYVRQLRTEASRAKLAPKPVFSTVALNNDGAGFMSARLVYWKKRPIINVVNVQQLPTKTPRAAPPPQTPSGAPPAICGGQLVRSRFAST